jgi:anti-sigma regulatory factor (Ser/Thr protein kinase)
VISLSPRPKIHTWSTVSFPSTLHLYPILDLLLAEVPHRWQPELRLGLQEALVNAAKHGNNLDPAKVVLIRFARIQKGWWWIIADQGSGFHPPTCSPSLESYEQWPCDEQECGRGLFLLYRIFDQVRWNADGTELTLYKQLDRWYGSF